MKVIFAINHAFGLSFETVLEPGIIIVISSGLSVVPLKAASITPNVQVERKP